MNMPRAVQKNLIPAALALLTFMVMLPFYESVARLWTRNQAAIEWHGVEIVTPIVAPGGILEAVYKARINRQCPADLQGFLIESDDSVPVRFPIVAGGYRPPSDQIQDVKVKVLIPKTSDPGLQPLHSGQYIYRTIATRYCPEGSQVDTSIPDVPFYLDADSEGK